MNCTQWQEAISAIADGEEPTIDARLVRAHVDRCPSCRAYETSLSDLRRAVAVEPAASMRDLAPSVVKQARVIDRRSAWQLPRIGLIVAAVAMLAIHAPALVAATGEGEDSHAARHGGAFGVAFAVGLLVVAARPARARGLLPVNLALAAALLVTAVIDIARGETPLLAEASHLPEVAGALLVWAISVPARVPPARGSARRATLRAAVSPRETDKRETA